MSSFKDFVSSLLRRGGINQKHVNLFLTEENMKTFQKCFTHSSFDSKNNYELSEFIGDGLLSGCIVVYITRRFPKVINVKWQTRIKHNLTSKKMLAKLAIEVGMERFVRYGQAMKDEIEKEPDLTINMKYISMMEDVMESTLGAIMKIIVDSGKSYGIGFEVCLNLVSTFYDKLEIKLDYKVLFDGVTRLKEMYESKVRDLRWPTAEAHMGEIYDLQEVLRTEEMSDDARNELTKIIENRMKTFDFSRSPYVITKLANGKFNVDVYGWPLGDKKPKKANRKFLAKALGSTKDEAKALASSEAMKVLDETYHIHERVISPYELSEKI